jgi:hypothetical protein
MTRGSVMSRPTNQRDEVRQILAAAADVLFSDGVPEEFLDQWAEETVFLLSASTGRTTSSRRAR